MTQAWAHVITRNNIDQLLDEGLLEVAMSGGRWWRIRRNGQTKRWKRDPNRIYLPWKAGLRVYGAIETHHFNNDGILIFPGYEMIRLKTWAR